MTNNVNKFGKAALQLSDARNNLLEKIDEHTGTVDSIHKAREMGVNDPYTENSGYFSRQKVRRAEASVDHAEEKYQSALQNVMDDSTGHADLEKVKEVDSAIEYSGDCLNTIMEGDDDALARALLERSEADLSILVGNLEDS